MEALHLIYQHWFLTIIILGCACSGVAQIIRAFTGAKED